MHKYLKASRFNSADVTSRGGVIIFVSCPLPYPTYRIFCSSKWTGMSAVRHEWAWTFDERHGTPARRDSA